MSGNPWIRFFPSDWLAGTRGMTPSEVGIYITLIALLYERGGKLENNPARLSRLCGASNSGFKRTLETLIDEDKIVDDGVYLSNIRVLEELSYTQNRSTLARDSANRRWGELSNKNSHGADANAMRAQCNGNAAPDANQKPEAIEDTPLSSGDVIAEANDPPKPIKKYPVQKAFDNWNLAAEAWGLPTAKTLTPDRRTKIRARLEEHGIKGWNEALGTIENSEFLRGENDRAWRANLDFMLQPSSFNKLLEGSYSNEVKV